MRSPSVRPGFASYVIRPSINEIQLAMKPPRTIKEALIALALFVFGLICLPFMIYLVGQQVVGEYENGLIGIYQAIGDALAQGNGFAWLLVFSPYLTVMLLRFGFWLRRQRRTAN